jgi:hypothetical protein
MNDTKIPCVNDITNPFKYKCYVDGHVYGMGTIDKRRSKIIRTAAISYEFNNQQ